MQNLDSRVLTVSDLSLSFQIEGRRFQAVSSLDLVIEKGKTLALVGESGCGKSVTALALMRLLPEPSGRIDSGRIEFGGRNLRDLSEKEMRQVRGREIAMIFQEPMTSLNPVFTVGDQIREAILIHQDLGAAAAKEKAIDSMAKVGIPAPKERYHTYPHELSGGMRQRIMIAMALSCEPEVLIADEPTTALDVTIQAQILDLIRRIQDETNMGVLLITHDLGIVAEVADRVAIMYAGQIVEEAEVEELFSQPRHPYTMALLNALPQKLSQGMPSRLSAIPGRVPRLDAIPKHCRFADRCGFVQEECRNGPIALEKIRAGRSVRCIRSEEI